jgi:hypothetical protein
MAVAYITEFMQLMTDANGNMLAVPKHPPLATQTVAIGTEADSATFDERTKFIRLHVDAICSYKIGDGDPDATTSDARMAAGQTEYIGVQGGHKISIISNT